jgi:hypothetical protein
METQTRLPARPARPAVSARRMVVTLVATGAATIGGLGYAPAEAQAASQWCTTSTYWNAAGGGCDGNFTNGSDRLVVYCKVIGAGFYYYRTGEWHNRRADWWNTVFCSSGSVAVSSWIEHRA